MRVDLHAHTAHSRDALTRPRRLVERATAVGLDKIAVTDHGTLTGALEARETDPARVIVGEEIHCAEGIHLIGLFLDTHVPHGLSGHEVAARIRDQGGVVYGPHPFAYLRAPRRKAALVLALADVIEVFNARAFWPSWNRRALRAARDAGRPGAASSDAHFPWEIGRAATVLPTFHDAPGLRSALGAAQTATGRLTSPHVHVASLALEFARGLRR